MLMHQFIYKFTKKLGTRIILLFSLQKDVYVLINIIFYFN